jgi:hypothetical protein
MDPSPVNPYQAPRIDANPVERLVLTEAELDVFLGGKNPYYKADLEQANQSGRRYAGFNWPCALFGSLWMFYRRMPVEGMLVFVLGLALSKPYFHLVRPHLTQQTGTWATGMLFVVNSVVVGFLGNPLLLRRARALVGQVRRDLHQDAGEALRRAGRPNPTAVAVGIVGEIGVSVLVSQLLHRL